MNISLFRAALVLLAAVAANASAQIHISGPLTGTLMDTTYIVDGEISVPDNGSLTIQPGAALLFAGPYSFTISGLLTAVGNSQDSIRFQPNVGIPAWGGINFTASADPGELGYCRFSRSNSAGVSVAGAQIAVQHSTFDDNQGVQGGAISVASGGQVTVDACLFQDNIGDQHGGGIWVEFATANVANSVFIGNRAENLERGKGGGISAQDGAVSADNCTFSGNFAGLQGGAIALVSSTGTFHYLLCYENTTASSAGAMLLKYSDAQVENSTFAANSSVFAAGAVSVTRDSFLDLLNSAVTGNGGISAISFQENSSGNLTYSDFFGNAGGNFSGSAPPGLGQISGVNANGDPCDVYFNIYLDPQYVNSAQDDYRTNWGSPLIDAGNPAPTYNDPDGTVSDLGFFFFDQSHPIRILLTPFNAPIQIAPGGGSFTYNVQLTNTTAASIPATVWIDATLPNGNPYGPIVGPLTVNLTPGAIINSLRTQSVPGAAPAGTYAYNAYAAAATDTSTDSFSFTKQAPGMVDGGLSGWSNAGESLGINGQNNPSLQPFSLSLGISPNPFNSSTALSYKLQATSHVNLRVFDASGRQVATLVDGWRQAGTLEVTFDGSSLPSGIYFARLTATSGSGTTPSTSVQKLVLLK